MYRTLSRVAAVSVAATTVLLTAAMPALAAEVAPPLAVADLKTVIGNITVWVTGIIATVATLFLTIGGARYLMAGGEPGEVEKAKEALKNAGKGYALALLAPILLTILNQVLGA